MWYPDGRESAKSQSPFFSGMLAPSPSHFDPEIAGYLRSISGGQPFQTTNRGLSLNLNLMPWPADTYVSWLNCLTEPVDAVPRKPTPSTLSSIKDYRELYAVPRWKRGSNFKLVATPSPRPFGIALHTNASGAAAENNAFTADRSYPKQADELFRSINSKPSSVFGQSSQGRDPNLPSMLCGALAASDRPGHGILPPVTSQTSKPTPSPSGWIRVGIYLQRLADKEQFVRVHETSTFANRDSSSSLYFDQDSYYGSTYVQRETSIFVRTPATAYEIMPAIHGYKVVGAMPFGSNQLDLAYTTDREGFELWGRERIARMRAGSSGSARRATWFDHPTLIWAVFGFDFDFNPVVILHTLPCSPLHQREDSNAVNCHAPFPSNDDDPAGSRSDLCIMWSVWQDCAHSLNTTLERTSDFDGIWYLKGNKLQGLNVQLNVSMHEQVTITIWQSQHEKQRVWYCFVGKNLGMFHRIEIK